MRTRGSSEGSFGRARISHTHTLIARLNTRAHARTYISHNACNTKSKNISILHIHTHTHTHTHAYAHVHRYTHANTRRAVRTFVLCIHTKHKHRARLHTYNDTHSRMPVHTHKHSRLSETHSWHISTPTHSVKRPWTRTNTHKQTQTSHITPLLQHTPGSGSLILSFKRPNASLNAPGHFRNTLNRTSTAFFRTYGRELLGCVCLALLLFICVCACICVIIINMFVCMCVCVCVYIHCVISITSHMNIYGVY